MNTVNAFEHTVDSWLAKFDTPVEEISEVIVPSLPMINFRQPVKVTSTSIGMCEGLKTNWLTVEGSIQQFALTKEFPGYDEVKVGDLVTFNSLVEEETAVYVILKFVKF